MRICWPLWTGVPQSACHDSPRTRTQPEGRDLYDGQHFTQIDTCDDPAVGAWLQERIFAPGASIHWAQLVEGATGEPLTPRYFVEEYLTPAE